MEEKAHSPYSVHFKHSKLFISSLIFQFITASSISFPPVILSARSGLPGLVGLLHLEVVALLSALTLQLLQGGFQPLTTVPGVAVFGHPPHNRQGLQHIHDVVDPPPFHP